MNGDARPSTSGRHAVTREIEESYDALPYGSKVHETAHPVRLATTAALRGLDVASVEHCRVLEIGCAEGGNLLPLAAAYPDSTFVGIDLSRRQIELASAAIVASGLDNIAVHHLDLLDLHDQFGEFDYVIAHGVYSWVPAEVQSALLAACASLLSPVGLAYVSYNTYPGWELKSMLRSMILSNARGAVDVTAQVAAARRTIEQLADDVDESTPYGALIRQHADLIRTGDDPYVVHEFLTPVNEPVSLLDFVGRAAGHALTQVGDAIVHAAGAPSDLAAQQYSDVVRGTAFRAAVLCSATRQLDDDVDSAQLLMFWVSSDLVADPEMVIDNETNASFVLAGHGSVATTSSVLKSALVHLSTVPPDSLTLFDLAVVVARSSAAADVPGGFPALADRLCAQFLNLHRGGAIRLSVQRAGTVQE